MSVGAFIRTHRCALALTIAALVVTVAAGRIFASMHEAEPIVPGPGVTSQRMLSAIEQNLAGTPGDTPVFELRGDKPGGTLMILGGTHPQEIAGMLAAVLMVENARVIQGRVIVVPQANRSGFTHTDPMEAYLHSFQIATPAGPRWFRVGMRLTNPTHQWPDPDVFIHSPSGERMVGHETRNLNRNHPGRAEGWLTARVSHALTRIVKEQVVDVALDLHEAQPEYPVINMMVAHEKAFETAATAVGTMQARRIPISLSASPKNLHGLSHREFGDHTSAQAMLTESANPAMGRFRGRTSEELLVEGRDANYVRAAGLKRLFVSFDDRGWPLNLRVARNLAAIAEVIDAWNDLNPEMPIMVEGIPAYNDVIAKGLGAFLRPPPPRS
jgi:Succinylglutamate desuccinylase / Aspartoacylase family